MSQKNRPPKLRTSPASRYSYLVTVALEYLRCGCKGTAAAKALHIDRKTLYNYMAKPEWDKAMEEAHERINQETAQRIVLERSMLDQILIKTLVSFDPTKKAFLANFFAKLMGQGYDSLGLGSQAPRIGISASAQAGVIQPNGQDAIQVFEAQWLTEKQQVWGTDLTQKFQQFLSTSIPEVPVPPNGPPKPE